MTPHARVHSGDPAQRTSSYLVGGEGPPELRRRPTKKEKTPLLHQIAQIGHQTKALVPVSKMCPSLTLGGGRKPAGSDYRGGGKGSSVETEKKALLSPNGRAHEQQHGYTKLKDLPIELG